MNHSEASPLLPRFVAGELDPGARRSLAEHFESCDECRAWVAASEALMALGSGEIAAPIHLSSHDVAALSLEPEAVDPAERRAGEDHAACCAECRDEIELVRRSVEAARESAPAALAGPWAFGRLRRPAVGLLAASLVAVAGAWVSLSRTPANLELTGRMLDGEQRLSARDDLVLGATEVRAGAKVTLRSGRSVSFGDGFSVGTDAVLVVDTEEKGLDDQDSSKV